MPCEIYQRLRDKQRTRAVGYTLQMAQLLVLYNTPADASAFDQYYRETHIPIAKKIPGLRKYTVSQGAVQALAGSAPYLIAILDFASMAEIQAALASPEGQAAAGDLPNFATGGASLLIYEETTV